MLQGFPFIVAISINLPRFPLQERLQWWKAAPMPGPLLFAAEHGFLPSAGGSNVDGGRSTRTSAMVVFAGPIIGYLPLNDLTGSAGTFNIMRDWNTPLDLFILSCWTYSTPTVLQ